MNTQSQGASAPTVFKFQESTQLRVVTIDGEPWFVAADVCVALDHSNVSQALKRLDDDEQALISNEGIHRGNDQVNVINESGLYSLILGSRKPEAKKFKKWVTSEVLPAIRKTGSYSVIPNNSPTQDPIEAKDHQRIQSIIWDITRFMRYESGWKEGVWYSLRKRTNTPSPNKFRISDLPLIADELRRVLNVAEKLRDYTRNLEAEVLREVIRGGADIDAIIAREEAKKAKTMADITHSTANVLRNWQIKELDAAANRTGEVHSDFSDMAERSA